MRRCRASIVANPPAFSKALHALLWDRGGDIGYEWRTKIIRARLRADPQMQIDALTALAQQRGWQVADVYVDNGVSGKKDSRPEFDRMMADAHAGRINVVCCWKFDRVGRSVQHLVRCLETFRALGIDFISVTESIDTSTPVGTRIVMLRSA